MQFEGQECDIPLETVLHTNGPLGEEYILEGYYKYLKSIDVKLDLDRRFQARGLCFIPARAPKEVQFKVLGFVSLPRHKYLNLYTVITQYW